MEDVESRYDTQIDGYQRQTKPSGIYSEIPAGIAEDVRFLASSIYEENVGKTTRGNNRLFIRFTCVCAAMSILHENIYNPYGIADIFGIEHNNIRKAFRSNMDIYNKYKGITKDNPMTIIRSRSSEYGFDDPEDFFLMATKFLEEHKRNEFIRNTSSVNIAAGLFAYYCEISGFSTRINTHMISIIFGISEQIINQKKEEIKRLDN